MSELFKALFCFLFFVLSVDGNQFSEVCKNLQLGSEKIYLIGLLKRHFILITNKFNLFDLPSASFDVDSHKLYLQKESVSLKTLETWKSMYDSMNGQKLQTPFIVRDSLCEYVVVLQSGISRIQNISMYNLDERTIQSFRFNMLIHSNVVFSSYEEFQLFRIYDETYGYKNRMQNFRFDTKTKFLNGSSAFEYDDKYNVGITLCLPDANHISNDCPVFPPPLLVESGFEDGFKFYWFTEKEVQLFDKSMYNHSKYMTLKLEKVPFANFFICGQRSTSTLDNSNEFSGSPTLLILCFVVALLLMAGLAIWFYLHRRHKGDNLAKQPKKMTSELKSTKSSRRQKSNKSIQSLRSRKSSSKRKSCKSLKSRKLSSKKSKSIKTRKSSKRSFKGKSKSRSLKRKSSSKLKRKSTSRLKRKSSSKRKSHKNTLKHNSSKQLQHLSKRNSLRKHSKRGSLGSLKKITR